ncbi:DUF4232 domain-containing protein [Kitasatospora sp. NPDC056651]|uniref:DUF4232 domain-containing protein n=1 Tax=Kitasatospora sp. NPDC056651 TaxID=3345892 RepID=UPI0036974321
MRAQKITFAAIALAAGLSLTACQNDDATTDQAKPTSAPTATTVPSTPAATTATTGATAPSTTGGSATTPTPDGKKPTSAGTSPAADKSGKCQTADLTITAADRTIDGDRERTVVVELKNHSGHDCSIAGYAKVDLNTTAGPLTADQSGEPVVPGVLKNGKSTFFGITYPENKSGGSGVRITGLRVTPPDDNKTVTLPWPGAASLPATNTPGSPVKFGPMGSAGQGN